MFIFLSEHRIIVNEKVRRRHLDRDC